MLSKYTSRLPKLNLEMRIEARMEIHDEDQIKIELVMPIIPNQPKIQCVKSSQTILITINAVFHSSENGEECLRNITRMKEYVSCLGRLL